MNLDQQWKALRRQLEALGKQARGAQGQARGRVKRIERRTRVALARALRKAEPQVRQAVAEAGRLGRGLRAGVKAGTAAYRRSVSGKKTTK